MLLPSPLLLPRRCLLLRALRLLLLGLLGTLCLLLRWPLLRLLGPLLLGGLRVLLLLRLLGGPLLLGGLRVLLLLRLLGALLLLGGLRVLLLLRLLGPLLLRLWSGLGALRLRLLVFFLSACRLRIRRDNRPEEQKQGGGADSSNELHISDVPPL
jgi:hypothetical protein